jgi:hypothetical protein
MMLRAARFVLALVVGLALVTWAASVVVQRSITRWLEKDLALRAELAVRGSHAALLDELRTEQRRGKLRALLSDLAQR